MSNLAIRNGLLAFAFQDSLPVDWLDTVPFDACIRLLDAVAAVPRMELYSVNQLYLERMIAVEAAKHMKTTPTTALHDFFAPTDFYLKLPSIDQATLRLLEGAFTFEHTDKSVGEPWKAS